MTFLDVLYDDFILFLETNGVKDIFAKGLLSERSIELSNRITVQSFLGPNVINRAFCWENYRGKDWRILNAVYCKRCTQLCFELIRDVSKLQLEPVSVYADIGGNRKNANRLILKRATAECLFSAISLNRGDTVFGYLEGDLVYVPMDNDLYCVIKDLYYATVKRNHRGNIHSLFNLQSINSDDRLFLQSTDTFLATMRQFNSIFEAILSSLPVNGLKIQYIDIDLSTGSVSYLPIEKVDTVKNGQYYRSKKRRTTTIGRLFNKLNLTDKFGAATIERFSTFLKTISKGVEYEVWEGEDITTAYMEENYTERLQAVSTLHNSCMRHPECKSYFKFYEAAGAKIVVVLDSNRKIVSRALLWEVSQGNFYLDRIYSACPITYFSLVRAVAASYNLLYYRIDGVVFNAKNNRPYAMDDYPKLKIIKDTLKNYSGEYPYLDSFPIYNKTDGELYFKGYLASLQSTSGLSNLMF